MASNPHVIDVDESNFENEIIQFGMDTPVVVDLWAEWCGPCKTLGPILEALALEADGAFRLAKVDVDKNPRLAQMFRAQSIPMVLALYQGQIVDQFVGALPKAEARKWLEAVLEAAGTSFPVDDVAPADPGAAEPYWQAKLTADASDGEAMLQLGRLYLTTGRGDQATELLGRIDPKQDQYNAAQAALELRTLLTEVADAGGEASVKARAAATPDDPEVRYLMALLDGASGRFTASLEVLVGLVGSAPQEVRERAKKSAATVFQAAGRGDEAVEQLRRKLARLLF